jgi:hypothetical protein
VSARVRGASAVVVTPSVRERQPDARGLRGPGCCFDGRPGVPPAAPPRMPVGGCDRREALAGARRVEGQQALAPADRRRRSAWRSGRIGTVGLPLALLVHCESEVGRAPGYALIRRAARCAIRTKRRRRSPPRPSRSRVPQCAYPEGAHRTGWAPHRCRTATIADGARTYCFEVRMVCCGDQIRRSSNPGSSWSFS